MSWQDRDYIRSATHGPAARWGGAWSFPWGNSIVTLLIVVNVVIFVLGKINPVLSTWIYGLGAMQGQAVMQGQLWRLITAQYLHADAWHLLFNMLTLHFMGRPLEARWSRTEFFTIYTLAGLAGNIFFTFLAWRGVLDPRIPAIGASGCVYGLIGIVAVLFPHATVYIQFLFPIKIRTAAIILGGIAFLQVLSRGENFGGEACHLAGLIFGVWWAAKGETWWSQIARRRSARISRVRPSRRRVVSKDPFGGEYDEEFIDRILKKVYDGGIHSLTEGEKIALREATERQKQREARFGRVD